MLVFLPEVFCEVVDEHLPVTTISEPRDALLVDRMVRQKVSKVARPRFLSPVSLSSYTRHGGRKMNLHNFIFTPCAGELPSTLIRL